MSAGDNLNPKQFFHGTVAEDMHEVTPRGARQYHIGEHDGTHAFATTSESDAWHYAELAWNHASTGVPRVYRVQPKGHVEQDPHRENFDGRWHRSKEGFDVMHEVPMPEHMGPAEDWR